MDRELIDRLACDAGGVFELLGAGDEPVRGGMCFEGVPDEGYPSLERFAALFAEECAKVAESEAAARRAHVCTSAAQVAEMALGALACDDLARAIRAKFKEQ